MGRITQNGNGGVWRQAGRCGPGPSLLMAFRWDHGWEVRLVGWANRNLTFNGHAWHAGAVWH